MRSFICTVVGLIGSTLSYLLGGWDTAIVGLCVFMLIDLVTGVSVALIFHRSPKNTNGKVESKQFLKGVVKKITIITLVGVAHVLDMVLTTDFIRTAVVITFIANETISIIENAGLMGIPIPSALKNALELLTKKEDKNNE